MRPPVLVTAPALEPVTVDEAKLYARIAHGDEDSVIARQIAAARRQCERATGRAFITQIWDWYLDALPGTTWWADSYGEEIAELRVPKPPLQAILAITTYDEAGVGTVFGPTQYRASVGGDGVGRIVLTEIGAWPTSYRLSDGIVVQFRAGYGAPADVPDDIKEAVLRRFVRLYQRRGDDDRPAAPDPELELIETNYQAVLV